MYYVTVRYAFLAPSIVEAVDNLEDAKALCEIYRRKDRANGKDREYFVLTDVK